MVNQYFPRKDISRKPILRHLGHFPMYIKFQVTLPEVSLRVVDPKLVEI